MESPINFTQEIKKQFKEDLVKSNFLILSITLFLFSFVYSIWIAFDYFLLPDIWTKFTALRLIISITVIVLNIFVCFKPFRRFILDLYFFTIIIFLLGISYMLPYSREFLLPYVMGFSLPILGAGIVPVWKPIRTIISIIVAFTSVILCFAFIPNNVRTLDIIAALFYTISASLISLIGSALRYITFKNDFITRKKLNQMIMKDDFKNEIISQIKLVQEQTKENTSQISESSKKLFEDIQETRDNIANITNKINNLDGQIITFDKVAIDVGRFIEDGVKLIDE